jgi:hypothetical protein
MSPPMGITPRWTSPGLTDTVPIVIAFSIFNSFE